MIGQFIEVVGAPVLIVGGVATLGWGWVPGWFRGSVHRPVAFGWGQLTMAAGAIANLGGDLLTNAPHLCLAVRASAAVVVLFGCWLLDVADWKPRRR
ncbi:hypothetical protein [Streptomyces sp. NPDC096311]|uniref:hypothetical protein n=1 Tax=Streptomyces sp. NPDC096311 TaxID=3366083 RepID=UPI00382E0610